MTEVLCVYRQVKTAASKHKPDEVAIIFYDEKPGIQAIETTAPDLPPEPGVHATFAREHEYKRHGTVSLLAGIDLVTGKVHALVKDQRECAFAADCRGKARYLPPAAGPLLVSSPSVTCTVSALP